MSDALRLDLGLDRRAATPLFRQIYGRVRGAILAGTLPPGTRLPSSRSLASQLSASRATVEAAYALLAGEGFIVSRGAAGTIVEPQIGVRPRVPPRSRRRASNETRTGFYREEMIGAHPFQMGLPALDAFPRKVWSRLAARRARGLSEAMLGYPDSAGYAPLRQEIVNYLAIARGVSCTVDQVFITAGFQGALGLITRALMERGDEGWFEDPGYVLAREALLLAGARLVPVPVDAEGLDVNAAIALAPHARFAFVTPSHHAPTGVALSLPRRLALLAWANASKAWIVEDDYDSEYRYTGRPLAAMKSLDHAGKVIYVGTFSKVLFPALRLGYVVVPDMLAARFRRVCTLLQLRGSLLDQMTVADFMAHGHFPRHIRRMRALYMGRRAALMRALERRFGDRLDIEAPAGGMHVIARLPRGSNDIAVVKEARAHGLAPAALSLFAMNARSGPGLLLSFTNIPVDRAEREVESLHRAIRASLKGK